nr:MAG TPA: hypothetical protein [Caudoviricetes sp.]
MACTAQKIAGTLTWWPAGRRRRGSRRPGWPGPRPAAWPMWPTRRPGGRCGT